MPTYKWSRLAVLLAVMSVCCFMFAGMAAASSTFSVTAESNPITGEPTAVLKADHTYDLNLEVTDINVPINQFTDKYDPCSSDSTTTATNKLYVDFPFLNENDNLGAKSGSCNLSTGSVEAWVTLSTGDVVGPIPVIPEIYEIDGSCSAPASVADRVYFTIERQFFPSNIPSTANVTGVLIEGLKVKTTTQPDDNYLVCVNHTACDISGCASLEVVDTVGGIDIWIPNQNCLTVGSNMTVAGKVWSTELDSSCNNKPWGKDTWSIIVELKTRTTETDCGVGSYSYEDVITSAGDFYGTNCFGSETCIGADTQTKLIYAQVVHPKLDGTFEVTFELPSWISEDELIVTARTIEVRDEKAAYDSNVAPGGIGWKFGNQEVNKVPAEANEDVENAKGTDRNHVLRGTYEVALAAYAPDKYTTKAHSWVMADEEVVPTYSAGLPQFIVTNENAWGSQIDVADVQTLEICLVDKYCNETLNYDNICEETGKPLKVQLRALDCDTKTIANGAFYSDENATNRIIDAEIPVGQSCVTVYYKPATVGNVSIEASAIFYPGQSSNHVSKTGICCIEINEEAGCVLEKTYLVTGDTCSEVTGDYEAPKAGWPVKISLHYNARPANIRVELLDMAGNPLSSDKATWDLVAITDEDPDTGAAAYLAYNADGQFVSGDTFM
ncbi:MAG: hypothetical protein PHD36_08955, partial [Desulfotomaculaceae bacterium]|nr:hypothetical protein [Desulfotomaculaceae bacterium]